MKWFLFALLFSCCTTATFKNRATNHSDQPKLEKALNYLASKCFEDGLHELIILRNGKVIYEGDSTAKSHNIWSCSKSFTSTVLGLLVKEERLTLDTPVAQIDPTLKDLYPKATLRHFTTMTSGYSAQGRSRWNDENADWSYTPYSPEKPHFEPGTHYEYWDEAQMMLGRLLTLVLKEPMKDYLDRKVMSNMDFGTWEWYAEQEVNGVEINNGCTNVIVNAKQLAQMGQLFLQKGKWENTQLLPQNWVEQALSPQVSASVPVFIGDRSAIRGSGSYGYNWWVNSTDGLSKMPHAPLGAAYMSGFNHNICMLIPEWNMVIVRMGQDGNPPEGKHVVWDRFIQLLGESLGLK